MPLLFRGFWDREADAGAGEPPYFSFPICRYECASTSANAGCLLQPPCFANFPKPSELAGATLMIIGVSILVRERHSHLHVHEITLHEHLHVHDEHQ